MPGTTQLLARTGVGAVGRFLHRRDVAIIGYHGVPDRAAFVRQLDLLADLGTLIGPGQLRRALAGDPLPTNPMLLTFDDGDPSVLDNAAPVLADRGIEAIIFVVGGLLDTTTPFWWDEVEALTGDLAEVRRLKTVPNAQRLDDIERLRAATSQPPQARQLATADLVQLQSAGFEIGNHTHLHPCLDNCTADEAIDQVAQGHQALLDRGITPTAFAYPNGNLDPRVEPVLRELGYDLGFLYDHHHMRTGQDPLRLSRLRLDASADAERTELIVSGVLGAIMRVRRRG